MLTSSTHSNNEALDSALSDQYEAPRVEMVLSAADLDRQVHYAGVIISCPGPRDADGGCPY